MEWLPPCDPLLAYLVPEYIPGGEGQISHAANISELVTAWYIEGVQINTLDELCSNSGV